MFPYSSGHPNFFSAGLLHGYSAPRLPPCGALRRALCGGSRKIHGRDSAVSSPTVLLHLTPVLRVLPVNTFAADVYTQRVSSHGLGGGLTRPPGANLPIRLMKMKGVESSRRDGPVSMKVPKASTGLGNLTATEPNVGRQNLCLRHWIKSCWLAWEPSP